MLRLYGNVLYITNGRLWKCQAHTTGRLLWLHSRLDDPPCGSSCSQLLDVTERSGDGRNTVVFPRGSTDCGLSETSKDYGLSKGINRLWSDRNVERLWSFQVERTGNRWCTYKGPGELVLGQGRGRLCRAPSKGNKKPKSTRRVTSLVEFEWPATMRQYRILSGVT